MTANPFQKATKQQLKARVALAGPTGSGKTYSALEWAQILAEGGRVAVVDTEHGSASLYADMFDFDVLTWAPPYDPGKLADTIVTAEKAGYAVIVLDSMSHFWEGEGGTLDIADAAGQRSGGNSFAGWKVATPALRHLIDTMLGCDMHVIGTMRSKMEYIIEEDSRGKKVPKKVGMAPVMRAGVEYEFTMVGDIDLEHRILFTKSRCSALADVMVQPGRAGEAAGTFLAWLKSGDPAEPRVEMVATPAAKAELFAAVGGNKGRALALWSGAFGTDPVPQVPRLDLDALLANLPDGDDDQDPGPGGPGTSSGPDGPGTSGADGSAREPKHATDGAGTPADDAGLGTPDEATVPAPEVDQDAQQPPGAVPPPPAEGAASDGGPKDPAPEAPRRPLTPLQRKMHALAGEAWPDVASMNAEGNRAWRDTQRKGLLMFLTGRDTSHDLSDDALIEVCDAIQQVIDGHTEVVQRANGEWTVQARTHGRAKKAAAKKRASTGAAA